ncbi:DUF4148 domain-containing protein [Pararobbsia alpina]|uniref:DUF4148 domain-containing protein n=1 Tax=Pararobbsia alpina TaxID=621374 RepID=A0A6S7B1U6_9BURK|nr:DUF4148 domain-containing protein [Pararobbsia alpina]CAB3785015.1 hypothetical protein LMG28138_01930 [Pararobbsia alpina]
MKRATRRISLSLLLAASISSFAGSAAANADSMHAAAPKMTLQGLTREQVRQDLHEAHRNGLLHANPNQYPSEYIEHAQRQLRTLASEDVKVYPKALME